MPWLGVDEEAIRSTVKGLDEVQLQKVVTHEEARRMRDAWEATSPLQDRRPDLNQVIDGCPNWVIELMSRCWRDDPAARPDFKAIESTIHDRIMAGAVLDMYEASDRGMDDNEELISQVTSMKESLDAIAEGSTTSL